MTYTPQAAAPTDHRVRAVESRDTDAMVDTLTEAFFEDPVWGGLFPDPSRRREQARQHWRFSVGEALSYPDSQIMETSAGELIALTAWFPPGADEIRPERVPAWEALIRDILPPEHASAMFASGDAFGAARPSETHAYLSLLAVAPAWRGKWLGMQLLSTTLE